VGGWNQLDEGAIGEAGEALSHEELLGRMRIDGASFHFASRLILGPPTN
jgi:hypothetical protein